MPDLGCAKTSGHWAMSFILPSACDASSGSTVAATPDPNRHECGGRLTPANSGRGMAASSVRQLRGGPGLALLAGLAFGSGQHVRGEDARDAATEVALPRHPEGAWQRTEQYAAVDEQHDDPDDDLPRLAGEEPEHDEERQPAEDQPGRADVVGLHPGWGADVADQPGAD